MKKLLFIPLLFLFASAFSQTGTDSANYWYNRTSPSFKTPMSAKLYVMKYLAVDSGLTVNKKSFFYDSVFFKGRAYYNVLPSTSDSSAQIASTEWVKKYIASVGGVGGGSSDTYLTYFPLTVSQLNDTTYKLAADTTKKDSSLVSYYQLKRYADSSIAAGGGGTNIYNSNGSVPNSTNRTVTIGNGSKVIMTTGDVADVGLKVRATNSSYSDDDLFEVEVDNVRSFSVGTSVEINKPATFADDAYFSGKIKLGGSPGTSGQVLTSQGSGAAPVWASKSDTLFQPGFGVYSAQHKNPQSPNNASGKWAFAFGDNNTASGESSTAWGSDNVASGTHSFALGNTNVSSGGASFSTGNGNTASGLSSAAFGENSTVDADSEASSVLYGYNNEIIGATDAAAGGTSSLVFATGGIAFGNANQVAGELGASIGGSGNQANGQYSGTFAGNTNSVTGVNSVVIGGNGISGDSSNTVYVPSLHITGDRLTITAGSNKAVGTASLSSGTVTVSNSTITSSSIVLITGQSCTNCGTYRVSAKVAGTSFTITSTNGSDASTVAYLIIN